jgi:hypothetical protein
LNYNLWGAALLLVYISLSVAFVFASLKDESKWIGLRLLKLIRSITSPVARIRSVVRFPLNALFAGMKIPVSTLGLAWLVKIGAAIVILATVAIRSIGWWLPS